MGKNLVRQKNSLEAATPQSLPGLSLRAGGRGISTATTPGYFLRKKGKMRPKELTTCSVPYLLTAYTRQLEIFLFARQQRIFYNNHLCNWKVVHKGTTQGSVSGPYLFNIFFNDLEISYNNAPALFEYADDSTIVSPVSNQC